MGKSSDQQGKTTYPFGNNLDQQDKKTYSLGKSSDQQRKTTYPLGKNSDQPGKTPGDLVSHNATNTRKWPRTTFSAKLQTQDTSHLEAVVVHILRQRTSAWNNGLSVHLSLVKGTRAQIVHTQFFCYSVCLNKTKQSKQNNKQTNRQKTFNFVILCVLTVRPTRQHNNWLTTCFPASCVDVEGTPPVSGPLPRSSGADTAACSWSRSRRAAATRTSAPGGTRPRGIRTPSTTGTTPGPHRQTGWKLTRDGEWERDRDRESNLVFCIPLTITVISGRERERE